MKPEKKGGQKGRSALPATPPPQKGRIGYRFMQPDQKAFPDIPEILLPELSRQIQKNADIRKREGGENYGEA